MTDIENRRSKSSHYLMRERERGGREGKREREREKEREREGGRERGK